MNPTGKGGFGDHPELIRPGPGRPKDTITPIIKAIGTENDGAKARALAETLWQMAIDGDVQAIKLVWTKLDGMPGQALHVDDVRDDPLRELLIDAFGPEDDDGEAEQVSEDDSPPLEEGETEAPDTGRRRTFE